MVFFTDVMAFFRDFFGFLLHNFFHLLIRSCRYDVAGFLEKNRDTLRDELIDLVKSSSVKFVSDLLDSISASVGKAAGGKAAASRKKATVASVFNESLANLIATMSKCAPYFVRCIKPNEEKRPNLFNNKMVLDQLRYATGLLWHVVVWMCLSVFECCFFKFHFLLVFVFN
jgi:hypothetical protein